MPSDKGSSSRKKQRLRGPDYSRPEFGAGLSPKYVMPFGVHKGKPLASIPTGYLAWLVRLPDIDGRLRDRAVDAIMARESRNPPATKPSAPASLTPRPEGRRPTRAERALMTPEDAKACRAAWRNHR